MKVKELISLLCLYDADLEVVCEYDSSFYKVCGVSLIENNRSGLTYSTKDLEGKKAIQIVYDEYM